MSESNYAYVRDKLELQTWNEDTQEYEDREPSNSEILRLLDALHADIRGVDGPELEAAKEDRYWNS